MGKILQVPSNSLFADHLLAPRNELRTGGIPNMRDDVARPDDLDLVGRGDEAALRRVIDEYSEFVYRVALGITGCEADAADVTQEVFIALPELLHSYDEGCFMSWLKVVASRKALMLVRAEERRAQYEILTTDAVSYEERALSGIEVERALGRLDPMLRAVFLLREVEGFTHSEIADIVEISENASRVKMFRARRTLRKLLTV